MDNLAEYLDLKLQNKRLMADRNKWKRLYKAIKPDTIRINRNDRAKTLVEAYISGDKSLSIKQIAEKCYLSHRTVRNYLYLANKIKQNLI